MKPRWIVCEDGDEYLTRFSRFLGDRFEFTPASDLSAALTAAPGAQGLLRERRHFDGMHIEMQQAGMIPGRGVALQDLVEHRHRLQGVGALGRLAGLEVPHLPGRLVHDRIDEDAADVEIVRVRVLAADHALVHGLACAVEERSALGEISGLTGWIRHRPGMDDGPEHIDEVDRLIAGR